MLHWIGAVPVWKIGPKTEYIKCVCMHLTIKLSVTQDRASSKPTSAYVEVYNAPNMPGGAQDPTPDNMLR